ncbi:MAG: ParB N-terminal domain-containing protein [Ruminococcus sp.]
MAEPNRQSGENEERIIEIEIERLRPFKEHPFQVKDDKEMFLLQESIEKYGILNPLIVRPVPDGYYEIISGHRRKHAAEKLGYRKDRYHDWVQVAFLFSLSVILYLILFAGVFVDTVLDMTRECIIDFIIS